MSTPISDARLQANRRNAQLSTGPKTQEGKVRSRANAVKHGLTGAGVALPTEDAAAVEARFLQLQEDLAPTTIEGALLLNLAALMSVQVERAARREAATLAQVGRHAAANYDLTRLAEIDHWFDTIETNPRDHHRRLQTSIDGIDRLLGGMQGIREQIVLGLYKKWTLKDRNKVDVMLGGSETKFPTSRADAILLALQGDLSYIPPLEQDQLPTGDAREAYFCAELIALVDAEAARLVQLRASIDPTIVADDRHEAVRRASLVASPQEVLLKKYQTSAISTFLRALRDFHTLEASQFAADSAGESKPTQTTTKQPVAPPTPRPAPVAPVVAPVVAPPESAVSNEAKARARIELADRILNGPRRPDSDPNQPFSAAR